MSTPLEPPNIDPLEPQIDPDIVRQIQELLASLGAAPAPAPAGAPSTPPSASPSISTILPTGDPALNKALVAKAHAETRLADAGVKKAEAEARKIEAEAREMDIKASSAERDDREKLADWRYQHIHHFNAATTEANVRVCMDRLNVWDQLNPNCDMEIVFTSPGGDAIWGMALFDYLIELRAKGHRITTVARGMAASMAGILLQAGDVRTMGREAWLLIHEVRLGAEGKIGDIEDTVEWAKKMCEHVLTIFVDRSGGKLTADYMKAHWVRKDWWLDAAECLRLGIIDEVR